MLPPDTPTIAESGLDFNASGWYGIVAPRNWPKSIVMTVDAATLKALVVPALRERLARQGVETIGSTPDEFGKVLREEWARWEKVIRVAGLKGQ